MADELLTSLVLKQTTLVASLQSEMISAIKLSQPQVADRLAARLREQIGILQELRRLVPVATQESSIRVGRVCDDCVMTGDPRAMLTCNHGASAVLSAPKRPASRSPSPPHKRPRHEAQAALSQVETSR